MMAERDHFTSAGEPSPEGEERRGRALESEASPLNLLSETERQQLLRAWQTVYRLLRYRPRTEAELRRALKRRGFSAEIVEAVLAEAKEMRWVDDQAFARLWVEQRSRSRPRATWVLARELRERGIDEAVIEASLEEVDDVRLAQAAAEKAWRRYRRLPWPEARQKLAGYLARRGFAYDIIREILEVWEAEHASPSNDIPAEESEP